MKMPLWNIFAALGAGYIFADQGYYFLSYIILTLLLIMFLISISIPIFNKKKIFYQKKSEEEYFAMNFPDITFIKDGTRYGLLFKWLYLEKERVHNMWREIPRKERKEYIKEQRALCRKRIKEGMDWMAIEEWYFRDYRKVIVIAGIQWSVKHVIINYGLCTSIEYK
jgi:hypothetical protein